MRKELTDQRMRRRVMLAATIAGSLALVPGPVSAEGLFDFFFGAQKQQARQAPPQANSLSDPFGLNQQPQQQVPAPRVAGNGPSFCVRSCDGKYFPLTIRGNATPVQMCQAFCPASATKVYYGGNINDATASNGERYADSENAFAYRKALRADCTCTAAPPQGWRRSISRSTPRCAPATWLPPLMVWLPSPASGSAPARPRTSPPWRPFRG